MKNKSLPRLFLITIALAALASLGCKKKPDAPIADVNLGATISGIIKVAPELTAQARESHTLYIIARKDSGPPLAVKRITDPQFPYAFIISGDDAMFPGTPFQGEVRLIARIDKDGNAGPAQSGDLEGTATKNPARVGDRDVDVTIDKAIP